MNTKQFVKLTSDTNYIPIKYSIIEITVGNSLASTYALIQQVSYGVATEDDLNDIITNYNNEEDYSSYLVGTLYDYQIVTFDQIKSYNKPVNLPVFEKPLG